MRVTLAAVTLLVTASLVPLSCYAQTAGPTSMSLATTLSQSVVSSSISTGSPTSTSRRPAPTTNSTVGESHDLFLWPPQGGLRQCERVTFAFTKPAVPLTCGIYVTNTSTYLEQVIIAPSYNNLVSGTFSWLVDMPIGLSVNVQVFVTLNWQVQQYTLPSLVVQGGQDNSCLGRNAGQNTQSIVSYASSLNESYVYTAPARSTSRDSFEGDRGRISGGTIAGIVIGTLAGLVLLILLSFYLRRRLRQRVQVEDSRKFVDPRFFHNPPQQPQQPSQYASTTYAQHYAQSVMSGRSKKPSIPPRQLPNSPPIAEVMSSSSSTTMPPITQEGTVPGLADPNSFVRRA